MKKLTLKALLVALLITFLIVGLAVAKGGPPTDPGPVGGSPGNQDPGQNPAKAVPNLAFPIIMTDVLQMFYEQDFVDLNDNSEWDEGEEWVLAYDDAGNLIPIAVDEVISDQYGGSYDGNEGDDSNSTDDDTQHCTYTVVDGCAVDVNLDGIIDDLDLTCEPMKAWLLVNAPWYDQPVFMDEDAAYDPNLIWDVDYIDTSEIGGANSWQADWIGADDVTEIIYIDFIDWGNPLENINPIVGQRFPVEVALYEFLGTNTLTAYKTACLEYPGTNVELFGTANLENSHTYEAAFATVLTNKFTAEVWEPNGTITAIPVSPGIGPSGKMNFASSGGGWIPDMPGWHRIWLHTNDPLISFEGAIVNNDEHYIMTSGCMAQTLNPNKLALTGIIGDSVYIDVLVVSPSGND